MVGVAVAAAAKQMMIKIKDAVTQKNFSYSFLSSVLSGFFPKDVKFMALQAFHQVNYMDASELYGNTQGLVDFIEKSLPDMDDKQREIIGRVLERLNDPQNPNKDTANSYIDEKFNHYKDSDKDKAALFLNVHMDQEKVYEVMKDKGDTLLSNVAQNRLPHIAQPKMIKEIVTQTDFTLDQKAIALQNLASGVDGQPRANNMTDADAIIVWAKDLDRKNNSGDKFYKAALSGIAMSHHKNKEFFLVEGMKQGLEPYRSKKGFKRYSEIPELAAIFGYLVELPVDSEAYNFFVSELDRMANSSSFTETQADTALTNLISFWQSSCEMADQCGDLSKKHGLFNTISSKYMNLKKKCPGIG